MPDAYRAPTKDMMIRNRNIYSSQGTTTSISHGIFFDADITLISTSTVKASFTKKPFDVSLNMLSDMNLANPQSRIEEENQQLAAKENWMVIVKQFNNWNQMNKWKGKDFQFISMLIISGTGKENSTHFLSQHGQVFGFLCRA